MPLDLEDLEAQMPRHRVLGLHEHGEVNRELDPHDRADRGKRPVLGDDQARERLVLSFGQTRLETRLSRYVAA